MRNWCFKLFSSLYFLLVLLCVNTIQAQNYLPDEIPLIDKVYKEDIKSVRALFNNRQPSYPLIALEDRGQRLVFSFDDLSDEVKDYTYRVVQCRSDWTLSDLDPFEFIDGFNEDIIRDYRFSFDTRQRYVSYQFSLPNAMTEFKTSGNYIVYVYADDDEENPVFTKRFVVYENVVGFNSDIIQPNLNRYFKTHQRLKFDVNFRQLEKGVYPTRVDPMNDFNVCILQNGRWDNAIYDLRPFMFRKEILQYYHTDQSLFRAGREFRYFDFTSLEFLNERTAKAYLYNGFNQVKLVNDEVRSHDNLRLWSDFNGAYIIERDATRIFSSDADYAYVEFTLEADTLIPNGDIFVYGALTNWRLLPEARMFYNETKNTYSAKLYLKQGVYNYQYVFLDEDADEEYYNIDASIIEGNYWATENDYIILVYFRPFGARYDRVVGADLINSMR